jgi:Zn-finger protein
MSTKELIFEEKNDGIILIKNINNGNQFYLEMNHLDSIYRYKLIELDKYKLYLWYQKFVDIQWYFIVNKETNEHIIIEGSYNTCDEWPCSNCKVPLNDNNLESIIEFYHQKINKIERKEINIGSNKIEVSHEKTEHIYTLKFKIGEIIHQGEYYLEALETYICINCGIPLTAKNLELITN